MASAIKAVARTLQDRGLKTLKGMVNVSINLNEAVTKSAEMIRDTREVDSRSQAIAAAAEELVASVNEIARNTEGAAGEGKTPVTRRTRASSPPTRPSPRWNASRPPSNRQQQSSNAAIGFTQKMEEIAGILSQQTEA
ncbi:MAG: hypothetical protein VW268_07265 [Rhodospirillaceae bacterium]